MPQSLNLIGVPVHCDGLPTRRRDRPAAVGGRAGQAAWAVPCPPTAGSARVRAVNAAWRLLAVLVLTPLPSLAAITLFEVVPLSPPEAGLDHNHSFYAREFLIYFAFCLVPLQQFCWQAGPALPMSMSLLVANVLVVAVLNVSYTYVMALMIGFPLPFTMTTSTPSHLLLETVALAVSWQRYVRANPDLVGNIVRVGMFFSCQAFMTTIYPLYYYAFTLLSDDDAVSRPAFLCVLAVIKLANRQLFHYLSRTSDGGEQYKPQMVVFNADVLGALFVAFCMQYKPSIVMAVGLAAVKVTMAMLSFHVVRTATQELTGLRQRIKELRRVQRGASSRHTLFSVIRGREATIMDEVAEIAAQYKINDTTATESFKHAEARVPSGASTPANLPINCVPTGCRRLLATRIVPLELSRVGGRPEIISKGVSDPTKPTGPDSVAPVPVEELLHDSAKTAARADAQGAKSELEHLERSYAALATKLLYMTEFMVLVEYVEVVVPSVYCTCERLDTACTLPSLLTRSR